MNQPTADQVMLIARGNQMQNAHVVPMIIYARQQEDTYAAINAAMGFHTRSALLLAEAPIHILHLDDRLLAAINARCAAHELVITANSRRHIAKSPNRPNPDQIRDALAHIIYVGSRKHDPETAELIGRHQSGRPQFVGLKAIADPTVSAEPRWYVWTSWWLNEKKLRQLLKTNTFRPFKGRAV